MKIFLKLPTGDVDLKTPFDGADHALADIDCPLCKAKAPLGIQGKGQRIAEDDRAYEADGYTTCCKRHVGLIRAEPSTIFGIREDRAVLHGRPRVY